MLGAEVEIFPADDSEFTPEQVAGIKRNSQPKWSGIYTFYAQSFKYSLPTSFN
jgi:hypothetical protein